MIIKVHFKCLYITCVTSMGYVELMYDEGSARLTILPFCNTNTSFIYIYRSCCRKTLRGVVYIIYLYIMYHFKDISSFVSYVYPTKNTKKHGLKAQTNYYISNTQKMYSNNIIFTPP